MSEWMPIMTAPPCTELNGDILLYSPEPQGGVFVGYRSERGWINGFWKSSPILHPTHWQPLPKPPKP